MNLLKPTYTYLFVLLLSTPFSILKAIESISIVSEEGNLNNSISNQAINDCIILLEKACACDVELNNLNADVILKLPVIEKNNSGNNSGKQVFPVYAYPEHHYKWTSKRVDYQLVLTLETPSFEGISFGLYGLLQEQLSFQFYHPKKMQIPTLDNWPLSDNFAWEAKPKFDKKGFHLHTIYPIELTEALLDANFQNGLQEIRTYIDWLARNQQNYFEFSLLESIDKVSWANYIKDAVRYARSRGVISGVEISLHATQKRAFKLYKSIPNTFVSQKDQIKNNIEFLCGAGFNIFSLEMNETEFSNSNIAEKRKLQLYIIDLLKGKSVKLMIKEPVAKAKTTSNRNKNNVELSPEDKKKISASGSLIQSVMFYSLSDKKAPVYKNENLQHLLEQHRASAKERETWYYPQSSFWSTFDNSVPMTLLPYLKARLDDIKMMDTLNAIGHVTISSGWEWGYWLTDWSIARWSWDHKVNNTQLKHEAMQFAGMLLQQDNGTKCLRQMLNFQQKYIKDKELIRYLSPLSFTDEFDLLNVQLQPRPVYTNNYIEKKALPYQLDTLKKNVVNLLNEYADSSDLTLRNFKEIIDKMPATLERAICEELYRGLQVTALRARHKSKILNYLIDKREAGIKKTAFNDANKHLESAKKFRETALTFIKEQEKSYRYPLKLTAQKLKSHTAFDFGYLYTVSELHFWKREEEQVRLGKYDAFFMNVFDMAKIMGLKK